MNRPAFFCAVTMLTLLSTRAVVWSADDGAAATTDATTTGFIDRVMGLIGTGKIDEAMAGENFLKNQPDARQAIRAKLIRLRDNRQRYNGYDVAAAQRISPRLQTIWVLAYYDDQPILFHLTFYRPSGNTQDNWAVLDFHQDDNIDETLKDMPMDYPAHASAKSPKN